MITDLMANVHALTECCFPFNGAGDRGCFRFGSKERTDGTVRSVIRACMFVMLATFPSKRQPLLFRWHCCLSKEAYGGQYWCSICARWRLVFWDTCRRGIMMTWDGRFRYDPSRGLSVLNTSQESSPSLQFSVAWVTEKAMDSGLDGLDAKIWQRTHAPSENFESLQSDTSSRNHPSPLLFYPKFTRRCS